MNNDPSREQMLAWLSNLPPESLAERIVDYDAEGWVRQRFRIHRFHDGENIGLPAWAKHVVIGGFAEQGWAAYDQRQRGKKVASGKWGDPLMLLSGGRITSPNHRYHSALCREARAASEAGDAPTVEVRP